MLLPRELDYKLLFPGPTGTNAVEAALKTARKATGRSNVISFTGGFHGVTVGSLAATANGYFRDAAGVALQGVDFMPYDGYLGEGFDTIAYLEKSLTHGGSGVALQRPFL